MRLHFARNGTHFMGQYCWSNAVILLPFATVFAIEFTMPVWAGCSRGLSVKAKTGSALGTIVLGFSACW